MTSISDIERRIGLLEKNLPAARDVFYWRSESFSGVEQLVCDMFNHTIPDDSTVIHTELRGCRKRAKIALLLDRVISAEQKCTMLEVRWEFLEQLRLQKLVNIDQGGFYQVVRRVRNELVAMVNRNDLLPYKVTALKTEFEPLQRRIVEQDLIKKKMLTQAQELLELFKGAISCLKAQVARYDAPPNPENSPYVATRASLEEELVQLEQDVAASYQELAQMIPDPFLKKVHFVQPQQTVDALLADYRVCGAEYNPWRLFGWASGTYWSSWVVNPGEVANRIKALSETAGSQITGLLADLAVGEVQGSFLVYERAIQKVQKTVDDAREKMVEVVADSDYDKLASYINGCDMALEELRRLLALAKDRGLSFSTAVMRAASLLKPFLEAKKTSFDLASSLFDVAEARHIYKTQPLDKPLDTSWTALSLSRVVETVDVIFDRYFNRYTTLTDEETAVWDAVMKGEMEDELTPSFQAIVIKWAMRALYANPRHEVNSRLELLLWKVKELPAYTRALDSSPSFKKATAEYNAYFSAFRHDPFMKGAHDIILKIFELKDDFVDFAKVVASSIDFSQSPIDESDQAKEKYRERVISLAKLLFSMLNTVAKRDEFPLLCMDYYLTPLKDTTEEKVFASITSLSTKEGLLYPEIDPVQRYPLVFESFLVRLLSTLLYGKSMKEKACGATLLLELFESYRYNKYFVSLSPSAKSLLNRVTMIKYHNEQKIHPAEWQLLLDGAIKDQDSLLAKLTLYEIIIRQPRGELALQFGDSLKDELRCYSLWRQNR